MTRKFNLTLRGKVTTHCVKIVHQIRSCFQFVFSWIQSEYKKIRSRNNFVFGHLLRIDGLPWSQRDAASHQGQNHIKGVISTLMEVKFNNSLETINDSILFPWWIKLCNDVMKVKNPDSFQWVVILRTRFSLGNSPGWIQPGYWDRMFLI